jgi:hypothetical protein
MKSLVSILLCMTAMLAFSQKSGAGNSLDLPAIENYNYMHAGDWKGRKFNEIIPHAEIERILVLKQALIGGLKRNISERSDFQDLISYLLASDVKAVDKGWLATESTASTFIIITKNGQIYYFEILSEASKGISAVTMNGPGKGARFGLEGYKAQSSQK